MKKLLIIFLLLSSFTWAQTQVGADGIKHDLTLKKVTSNKLAVDTTLYCATKFDLTTISGGGGTVSSISAGYGTVFTTITTTGAIVIDTGSANAIVSKIRLGNELSAYATNANLALKLNISDTATMLSHYAELSELALKLNISDTAAMLSNYTEQSETALKLNISDTNTMLSHYAELSELALKVNISDTAAMLSHFVEYGDTASMLANYAELSQLALKVNISDTAAMLANYVETLELNAKRHYIRFENGSTTVAANQTYYGGSFASVALSTTAALRRIYFTSACTITDVTMFIVVNGVGSNNSISYFIRKNNSSDTALTSSSITATSTVITTTGLSLSIAAGDYIEIKTVTTTLASSHTGYFQSGTIGIQ